jgi:hypothetical protein
MIQAALKDTIGLLTGKAFRVPLDDTKTSVANRFKGRKVALLSYGSNCMKFGSVTFKGGKGALVENVQIVPAQLARGALGEAALAPLKALTDCKSVIVLIGDRVLYSYKTNLRQTPVVGELVTLANDPRQLLGNDIDVSCRYALLHHPVYPQTIELSVERSEIDMLYRTLTSMGLTVARIQSATGAILSGVLPNKIFTTNGGVLVVVDHGAVTALTFGDKGTWTKDFRHQDNVCRPGDWSRLERLLTEVAPADGVPFILVDTGTSDLPDVLPSNVRRYGKEDGAPGVPPEFYFAAVETAGVTLSKGLGHEFGRVPTSNDTLPASARLVPVAFYLGMMGLIGATGYQMFLKTNHVKQQQQLLSSLPGLERQKAEVKAQEAEGHALNNQTETIAAWLERTVMIQPLMVRLAEAFDERIRIATLSISRSPQVPGSYQLNMTFSVEAKELSKFEETITAKAHAAGWRLVAINATPNAGLFTYTALLTPETKETP